MDINYKNVKVRINPKTNKKSYGCYVYVREWYNTITAFNFCKKIKNEPKKFKKLNKIVYDDPHYWIILPNTSRCSYFPIPTHTDLEFVTYEGVSFKTIEMVFNALNIGRIHSISMRLIDEPPMQEIENSNRECNLPCWIDSYKWNENVYFQKVRVTVHFEYWYRSFEASMFLHSMSVNNNMECVIIPVFDGNLNWKIFKSSNPPIADGINPYIWFNPEETVQSQTSYNAYLQPPVNRHTYFTEDGEETYEKPPTYHQEDETYYHYYDHEDQTYKYYTNHSPTVKTLDAICENSW
jgi:hypothetical protein